MAFGIDDFALLLLGGGLLGAGQAGLNMAGSAMTYGEQRKLQKKAQEFEAKQSQINRDWMTEMSNSAHQREVADLRSAGLNPILSATGGSGASTPSASTAVSGNMPDGPDFSGLGDSMTKGFLGAIESGLDMKKASAAIDNTNANTTLAKTESLLKQSQTDSQELRNSFDAATQADRIAKTKSEKDVADALRRKAIAEAEVSEVHSAYETSREGMNAYRRSKELPKVGFPSQVVNLLYKGGQNALDLYNWQMKNLEKQQQQIRKW